MTIYSVESRIQAYLRAAGSRRRETLQIGPFLATFTSHSDNPYLSYAMPDDSAEPTPDDIAGFIEASEAHGRTPRLEYVPGLAPMVEPALLAAGFVVECRTPLMTCLPGQVVELAVPAGITLLQPATVDEIHEMATAQHEAYGGGTPSPEDVAWLQDSLAAGAIAVLARETQTGVATGGGVCTVPIGAASEVAGIGVREAFRRRGIAGALTARLTQEAFASGVTLAFLMAATDVEARIYARAGFTEIGEVLHISRPSG